MTLHKDSIFGHKFHVILDFDFFELSTDLFMATRSNDNERRLIFYPFKNGIIGGSITSMKSN
ncbi:Uncharacterised protein [Mycobacterium tuberculosis]|nr:Uncharacterised protein [Mycobacterium tuberculosis]